MKAIDTYVYEYDPNALVLNIMKNGKQFGGFIGQPAEQQLKRLLDSGADITITNMSESIRKAKVRRLRAIWVKQGIDQYRESILSQYGVESTSELDIQQLEELIDQYSNQAPVSEHVRRQRSIILDLLNKMGIYKDNGDWKAVNAYLMQPRISGKLMYQMSSDELNVLQQKLRAIIAKQLASEAEINRKKLLN
ncbi:MAG: hypothetical protein KGZ81_13600 [Flavobacteriales bacterium]|nr:hypothetical protein [Flavobacteriales bacterium]